MNIVEKASVYAADKHKNQKRKDGKPYFTHVEAVAKIVSNEWSTLIPQINWNIYKDHVVAAAFLHDVIEDCGVTKQDLLNEGFSVMTAEIVDILSKKKGENYFDFIMRIMDSGAFSMGVIAVKLADLEHNMSDLNEGSLKDKYRLAKYCLSKRKFD